MNARSVLSNVWVIIPALDEESSIGLVLGHLPPVGRVIVVDNGSSDATAAIAKRHGADVVSEPRRGYGAACLRGLEEVWNEETAAPEIVAFVDADFSDHPDELPSIVEPIFEGEADFVLGTRLRGHRESGAMPPQSVFGNALACWLMRLLWKAEYTDLGPFRAIEIEALKSLGMSDTNFGWTVEMQIRVVQQGLRVREVPVHYRRRVGVSKISWTVLGTLKAGTKILYLIGKYGILELFRKRSINTQPEAPTPKNQ
ncbi:MAG: UDP-glucose--dolichyl-phosphate glucosyltransferase [Planctomycetaceae bacterium]|nr:UDP-glucose--dolichyl-phosphate glucosyltransferase [Planctomycetaceae bacterium]